MTIGSETSLLQFAGNGSTTAWAVSFYFETDDDIVVWKRDAEGALTEWTRGTEFTLTGAGDAGGGTLTTASGFTLASGEYLEVRREPEYTQTLDLVADNSFVPETLEKRLDRLTAQVQRLRDDHSRSLRVPRMDLASSLMAAYEGSRASKVLAWDANGNLATGPSTTDLNNLISASEDPTDAQCRTVTTASDLTTTGKTLLVYQDITVSSNITITEPIKFVNGGRLLVATGVTVTFSRDSGIMAAGGSVTLFSITGTGAVTFASGWHQPIWAGWFGVVANGSTDDTIPLQKALQSVEACVGTLLLPAGTVKITDTIFTAAGTSAPQIIGQGPRSTTISYTFGTAKSALKLNGGSGTLIGGVISGIAFVGGDALGWGIELAGQDGVVVENCRFGTNAVGCVFHNESAGEFTEYCVLKHCIFDSGCVRWLHYKITSGNVSFHGSGLLFCQGTTAVGNDQFILIDATAIPYNCPMVVQWWVNTTAGGGHKTFIQNNSTEGPSFWGWITVETFYSGSPSSVDIPEIAGGSELYLAGDVISFGSLRYGTCYPVEFYQYLGPEAGSSNGSRAILRKQWSDKQAMTTGGQNLVRANVNKGLLVWVTFSGSNYDYRYLLAVNHEGYSSAGSVVTLATLKTLNTAGYGAPTFSVDNNGWLVATNGSWPASGVTATIWVVPIGLHERSYSSDTSTPHYTP